MDYCVDDIREIVRGFVSEKRFKHILGVEREAYKLGKIFIPDKVEKLRLAGLLHDITKDFNTEKQLELCDQYGIKYDLNNLVPKLLHAKTGCAFARNLLNDEIVDEEVYNGIAFHTTGRAQMTLFEAIVYLADYIEDTRTFEDCVFLRDYFYKNIELANDYSSMLLVLQKTMILSFNLTIKNLMEENKQIDSDTIDARNYFVSTNNVFNS